MLRSARRLLAEFTRLLRRVAGMPDYAAYVTHRRAHHAGEPIATEREYFAHYVAARYGDGPTRCC